LHRRVQGELVNLGFDANPISHRFGAT